MVERNCEEDDKIIVLLKKTNFKNKLFGPGEMATWCQVQVQFWHPHGGR